MQCVFCAMHSVSATVRDRQRSLTSLGACNILLYWMVILFISIHFFFLLSLVYESDALMPTGVRCQRWDVSLPTTQCENKLTVYYFSDLSFIIRACFVFSQFLRLHPLVSGNFLLHRLPFFTFQIRFIWTNFHFIVHTHNIFHFSISFVGPKCDGHSANTKTQ